MVTVKERKDLDIESLEKEAFQAERIASVKAQKPKITGHTGGTLSGFSSQEYRMLLEGKLMHIKIFKSLFEQTSIQIRQHQTRDGQEYSTNRP